MQVTEIPPRHSQYGYISKYKFQILARTLEEEDFIHYWWGHK